MIGIIDYGLGNLGSLLNMCHKIGRKAVLVRTEEEVLSASHLILPGVGTFDTGMKNLESSGLIPVLKTAVADRKIPVLGICLGMQLMCRYSEENDTECLGIFQEEVRRFEPGDSGLKVPQIGWNNVRDLRSPLFEGIKEDAYFYFVHSYFAAKGEDTIGVADYIQPYSAALHRRNFYGVQFHPEKSAIAGERLLTNFMKLT